MAAACALPAARSLICSFPASNSWRAGDDRGGGIAAVGVFQLRLHAGGAEIHFGGDAGVAEVGDDLLVVGEAVLIHHGDDDGAVRAFVVELADGFQRGGEPRDADGETGRRNVFAAEAADEAVVAPSPADRAEDDRLAFFVRHFEGELGFEDGAGVVFEAADDGGIDTDSIAFR